MFGAIIQAKYQNQKNSSKSSTTLELEKLSLHSQANLSSKLAGSSKFMLDDDDDEIVEQKLNIKNIKTDTVNSMGVNLHTANLQQERSDKSRNIVHKSHRPSTLVSPNNLLFPKQTKRSKQTDDIFYMAFYTSPNHNFKSQNDQNNTIQIKNIRSFNAKFIRQLNFKQNEKSRKTRRKQLINNKIAQLSFSNGKIQDLNKLNNRNRISLNKPYNRKHMVEINHDGTKILAEFKNEVLHGDAQFYYRNGAKFIGRYSQGVRIHGVFDFNNGYYYSGSFLGDKFHGDGSLSVPSGKTFTGDWNENQLPGKVQIKYPSGDVYYGQTKQFKKHGKGYLFFKNGDKFVGQFDNGKISGKGQYFVEEKCIGRGIWKNGQLIKPENWDDQISSTQLVSRNNINSRVHLVQFDGRIKPKPIQESEQIFIDDIQQEASRPIQIRSNNKMTSFRQIDQNNQKLNIIAWSRKQTKKSSFKKQVQEKQNQNKHNKNKENEKRKDFFQFQKQLSFNTKNNNEKQMNNKPLASKQNSKHTDIQLEHNQKKKDLTDSKQFKNRNYARQSPTFFDKNSFSFQNQQNVYSSKKSTKKSQNVGESESHLSQSNQQQQFLRESRQDDGNNKNQQKVSHKTGKFKSIKSIEAARKNKGKDDQTWYNKD